MKGGDISNEVVPSIGVDLALLLDTSRFLGMEPRLNLSPKMMGSLFFSKNPFRWYAVGLNSKTRAFVKPRIEFIFNHKNHLFTLIWYDGEDDLYNNGLPFYSHYFTSDKSLADFWGKMRPVHYASSFVDVVNFMRHGG